MVAEGGDFLASRPYGQGPVSVGIRGVIPAQLLTRVGVPKAQGTVSTRADQPSAVRAERHGPDEPRVPQATTDLSVAIDSDHGDFARRAGDGQPSAVRRQRLSAAERLCQEFRTGV